MVYLRTGGVPMQTECSADLLGFAPVEARRVVATFDGGTMTSEAGAMLLGASTVFVEPGSAPHPACRIVESDLSVYRF
jgi:hypothetical protein